MILESIYILKTCVTLADFGQLYFEAVWNHLSSLRNFLGRFHFQRMCTFVFNLKCRPKCLNDPKHLRKMRKKMRYIPEILQKEILKSVVKRGAYNAREENALNLNISDDSATICKLGFRCTIESRQKIPRLEEKRT